MTVSANEIVQTAIDASPIARSGLASDPAESASDGTSFDDLGFDSLALMEFCISIHVNTGIEMTVDQVAALGSPKAVVSHLEEIL